MIPQRTLGSDPAVDTSIWNTAMDRIGGFFRSLTNEFLHICQARLENDAATQSYEKSVGIDEVLVEAPSDYVRGIMKDGVGRDRRAILAASYTRGWGGYDEVELRPGVRGFGPACEVAIRNNSGAEEPNLDTPGTTVGHLYTATGAGMATAAAYLPGKPDGQPSHHNGFVVRQNALPAGRQAWEIRKQNTNDVLYAVDRDGNVRTQELRPAAFFPRFVVQPDTPALKPGECCIWGETDTGTTRLLFFDGATQFAADLRPISP